MNVTDEFKCRRKLEFQEDKARRVLQHFLDTRKNPGAAMKLSVYEDFCQVEMLIPS